MLSLSATIMGLKLLPDSDGIDRFSFRTSIPAVHDREITGENKPRVLDEKFKTFDTIIENLTTVIFGTSQVCWLAKPGFSSPLRRSLASKKQANGCRPFSAVCWTRRQPTHRCALSV
jgi:hypothetical protein